MPSDLLQPLAQFGVASLMGLLWVWERSMSRKREAQLNDAHCRLMSQQDELRTLVKLVRQNTRAIVRFDQTQNQLKALLEKMHNESKHRAV